MSQENVEIAFIDAGEAGVRGRPFLGNGSGERDPVDARLYEVYTWRESLDRSR